MKLFNIQGEAKQKICKAPPTKTQREQPKLISHEPELSTAKQTRAKQYTFTPILPTKRQKLPNTVLIGERYNLSNVVIASIVNGVYKDLGIGTESNIVDKNKIGREKAAVRAEVNKKHSVDIKRFFDDSICCGLFFDEKKDLTLVMHQNDETKRYHQSQTMENHCTLLLQPGDIFYSYVTPDAAGAEDIFNSILAKLEADKHNIDKIVFVGCDAARTNVGKSNGEICVLNTTKFKLLLIQLK